MNTGVKRSLFTKPAWAAPAASAPSKIEGDGSVFGRNVAYDDIVQAEQAKRERKAAKAKLRADKGKSVDPSTKRRRISVEQDNETASETGSDHGSALRRKASEKRSPCRERPVTRSVPLKDRTLGETPLSRSPSSRAKRSAAAEAAVFVEPDEDEDDGLVMLNPARTMKPPTIRATANLPVDDDESDEDDEYLRHLKQKARDKMRLLNWDLDSAERAQSPLASSSADQSQTRPVSAGSGQAFGRATPASEQEHDPTVKILIQSDIPNTSPLIVKRLASQSLKQVREFWCKRWQLDDHFSRKVFFTWRGTRLFDSTTMRGIIQKLKEDHRQQSTGIDEDDDHVDDESRDDDPSGGKILLEAVTQEIYEEKMRQKEQRQKQASADEDQDSEDAGLSLSARPDDREAAGAIVVRLVSQAYEPLQLRVRPHTTVGKIMRAYTVMKKLDDSKTPWLVFDGDRLDPDATVQDVGLEAEDEVEVNIR